MPDPPTPFLFPLLLCFLATHTNTQRKKTLLVEYKQLRKANTFIDRRFGGGWVRV